MSIYSTNLHNLMSGKWNKRASVGCALLFGLSGLVIGCGSTTNDTSAAPISGNGGSSSVGAGGPFTATVIDSVNEATITGSRLRLTVRALDNETGQPLAGQETTNDDSGKVTFSNLPAGKVGFMIVGVKNQAIDTYSFNVDSNAKNESVRVTATSSVINAMTSANLTLDSAKGAAAGAIYWVNAKGENEPVGCATVRIDPAQGDIRYFGANQIPTTNAPIASAPNLEVRTNSNPLNGKFYVGNVSPGKSTVTAMLNGQDIGSASLPVFAGTNATDGKYVISLSNIFVQGQNANPTPAGCK